MNQILPTIFTLHQNGKIISVMDSHVDDLDYGSLLEAGDKKKDILGPFAVRGQRLGQFWFWKGYKAV